jgi:hypothetical protein
MREEERYSRQPKVDPKMGHGRGTVVDADDPGSVPVVWRWIRHAEAGCRLLVTGSSHAEIKSFEKLLREWSKLSRTTLVWRFAREVKVTQVYVHPEWIDSTSTEYQAWVLLKARGKGLSESQKRHAVLDSVLGQLDRDERENPTIGELPEWVATPFEYTA